MLLFSHFTGKQTNIQDPYYGGNDGFDACYKQCQRYSTAILEYVRDLGASGTKADRSLPPSLSQSHRGEGQSGSIGRPRVDEHGLESPSRLSFGGLLALQGSCKCTCLKRTLRASSPPPPRFGRARQRALAYHHSLRRRRPGLTRPLSPLQSLACYELFLSSLGSACRP